VADEPTAPIDPGTLNRTVWAEGRFVRSYAHRQLRPVEVLLLLRYHDEFRGRVLELGCGAGRLTGYLAELASEAYGIDLSSAMIAESRARYPQATFIEGDIRNLSHFDDGSLDIVFGSCNILDIFGDAERRETLREIHRVLRPGGLLMMSAHNRAHLSSMRGPTHLASGHPLRVARDALKVPGRVVRHRRLAALERQEPGYAIVNNAAHDYSLVHYFITRDAQFRQLEDEGFEPLECLDEDGKILEPGDNAAYCLELHYVARAR
jgi:SAM-dependent methyltransferase